MDVLYSYMTRRRGKCNIVALHEPQAVQSDLLLYADDTCLVYSDKNVLNIEKQLNNDFNSLCDWFEDNKLSIHFGQEKTKSIICSQKEEKKESITIKRGDTLIIQHSSVTYLGCLLDEDLSGESMATKVLGKINGSYNPRQNIWRKCSISAKKTNTTSERKPLSTTFRREASLSDLSFGLG